MIKNIILFILLSISSITAYAIPTVTDIEYTINNGDYSKAKEQLKEVLKVHPNSVVANKYMLEIIKIEYAGSLKPSVEFKIYENNLKQIELHKQLKIQAEKEALRLKQREESFARFQTFMYYLFITFILILLSFVLYKFINIKLKENQEQKKKIKWLNKVNNDTTKLNEILSKYISNSELLKDKSDLLSFLEDLYKDNLDVIQAINDNDYSVQLIDNHLRNSWSFLDRYGIE